MFTQRGMSTGLVIGVVIILALIAGGFYAMNNEDSSAPAMEEKGDAMMEKKDGDAMMKMEDGTVMSDEDHSMMMEKKDGDAMMKDDGEAMMKKEESGDAMKKDASFKGAVIAGSSAPLLEFNQRDYETALAQGRVVALYFYASWCPLCKKEFENTKAAFNAYEGDNLVGFRVHFNDGEVTPEMEALAREFGVAYQHTKVFIKDGERILKSPETWNTQRYLNEFAKATNN